MSRTTTSSSTIQPRRRTAKANSHEHHLSVSLSLSVWRKYVHSANICCALRTAASKHRAVYTAMTTTQLKRFNSAFALADIYLCPECRMYNVESLQILLVPGQREKKNTWIFRWIRCFFFLQNTRHAAAGKTHLYGSTLYTSRSQCNDG